MADLQTAEAAAPASSISDADVVAASLSDPPRFAALFDRHYDAVHRYAQRRAGISTADEVASETFLRAFDRRARFDPGQADARPWLLGIATNVLRRHWRSERRRLAAYARSGVSGDDAAAPASRALADETVAALRGLRRDEREALLLYAWGDLSYEEIGRALDIPLGTVRSRISRARGRLRSVLEPAVPTPPAISEEASHV